MKLIKPKFEIISQDKGLDGIYKHIELCGRTCYKSTDKITNESAKPFVDRMIASQHYAMLEHATVYLKLSVNLHAAFDIEMKYQSNSYSRVVRRSNKEFTNQEILITTNFRVLIENHWLDDLQYICYPTNEHYKRYTVKFICNRQVSHEFVRHRVFSFAQESTRYCNYTKDKFGGELTFIQPCWNMSDGESELMKATFKRIEENYLNLIKCGWKPQQAATVLPNGIKTELLMTGFEDDWIHFFDLRADGTTGKPHPQAEELAKPLKEEFIKRGYIE